MAVDDAAAVVLTNPSHFFFLALIHTTAALVLTCNSPGSANHIEQMFTRYR
jgi:hypothetical protein